MNAIYRGLGKRFVLTLLMIGAVLPAAHAKTPEGWQVSQSSNPKWKSECGACHVLYSPRMLSATSWRAVMSGLNRHFGTDASLDSAAAKEVGDFLERNAGNWKYPSAEKTVLRITETRWFAREHRKLASKVWTSDWVKSPANCTACHAQEPSGNYSERNVSVPR